MAQPDKFGSIIAVLGLGLFAIPTGILVSGFNEHIQDEYATDSITQGNQCELLKPQVTYLQTQLHMQETIVQGRAEMLSLLRGDFDQPN